MKKYLTAISIMLLAASCSQTQPQISAQPKTYQDCVQAGGVVAAGGAGSACTINGKTFTAPEADSNSSQPDTSGWNTYTSPSKYGFSIKYPSEFGFNTDINKVRSISYIAVCDETMVACVFLTKDAYKDTNFDGAAVSINIDKSLNTENKCYNFKVSTSEAQTQVADATINGIVFKSAIGGGGAAGHFDKLQVYRNFRNGMCYELAQDAVETNIANYPAGTIQQVNQDEVWNKLQAVIKTFIFSAAGQTDAQNGSQVTISGTTVCLPHKNSQPGQPQTLECAIGLQDKVSGKYYSLKNFQNLGFDVNKQVTVTGTLEDDSQSKYDVAGAIDGAVSK